MAMAERPVATRIAESNRAFTSGGAVNGSIALPASLDAEKAILGGVILDNFALADAAGLRPDDFSLDAHRRIFRRMLGLSNSGGAVDIVTLSEELGRHRELKALGGVAYLSSLTEGLPRRPSIEQYVKLVKDKALLRALIDSCNAAIAAAREQTEPTHEILAAAESTISAIAKEGSGDGRIASLAQIPDIFTVATEPVRWAVERFLPRTGISVLATAPGLGKTYIACAIAKACGLGTEFVGQAAEQRPVLYLDRENSAEMIRQRLEQLAGGPVPGVHAWGLWLSDGPPLIGDSRLLKIAESEKPVMIFDSLNRFHSAESENDARQMAVVMGQLRELASKGAAVLVLHHRSKAEASAYRGSSEIMAGCDLLITGTIAGPNVLRLTTAAEHGAKNRLASGWTLHVHCDLERGRFELTDGPATAERRDVVAEIARIVSSKPGINANSIAGHLHLGKAPVLRILKEGCGRNWRRENGPRKSHLYFPTGPAVPEPVRPDAVTGSVVAPCKGRTTDQSNGSII
jgi:hypothetical protein